MKVVFVDKPIQDSTTLSPQLIDGKVYFWDTHSTKLYETETLRGWLEKTEERIKIDP